MGCGSSKPVAPYEAKAARVSAADVTAADATYSWMCKPASKEWQGEWRSGTSKDAPKEMGAESMLYSLGADLGLCLAILSAMQAWPVLEIMPEKKNSLMPSYGEMLGIAAEAALG